jgi:quercetin dioxygenase-like cupin family protein
MTENTKPQFDSLSALASNLESLVNYQEGSVVSRALIDKSAGTVTLFAFAAGQGLSEHSAPYDALVYILDGEAEITILPANEPHALKANRKFKMMLVMIKA